MNSIPSFQNLLPVLKIKKNNFKLFGIDYISERDIWNYLNDCVWSKDKNINIDEIVNDILYTPAYLIKDYIVLRK